MSYTIFLDTSSVEKHLENTKKQIPFVIANGITQTARGARDHFKSDIPDIFDTTNAFTRNATAFSPANKQDLIARVFIKDQQAKYLRFEEYGGTRTPQDGTKNPSAKAIVVAGKGAKKTSNGTLPKSYIASLSRQITKSAQRIQGKKRKAPTTSVVRFSGHGPNDKGTGGFYLRDRATNKIIQLVSFVSQAPYKPKMGFNEKITEYVNARINKNLSDAIDRALKSKKP